MKHLSEILLAAVAAALFVSCGKEENADTFELLNVPKTGLTMQTTAAPFQVKYKGTPTKWLVIAKNVVEVSETGLITVLGCGTTSIQVTDSGGSTTKFAVRVNPQKVDSYDVASKITCPKGGSVKLLVTNVSPSEASLRDLAISVSGSAISYKRHADDPNHITISLSKTVEDGESFEVKFKNSADPYVEKTCTVTEKHVDLTGIQFVPASIALSPLSGQNVKTVEIQPVPSEALLGKISFTAQQQPMSGSGNVIEYEYDEASGKVSITALDYGTAVLKATATATAGGTITAQCSVDVAYKEVESFSFNVSEVELQTLGLGSTFTLEPVFVPETPTDASVEYSVSGSCISFNEKTGLITAKAEGTATITGTCSNKALPAAKCVVKVVKAKLTSLTLFPNTPYTIDAGYLLGFTATQEPAGLYPFDWSMEGTAAKLSSPTTSEGKSQAYLTAKNGISGWVTVKVASGDLSCSHEVFCLDKNTIGLSPVYEESGINPRTGWPNARSIYSIVNSIRFLPDKIFEFDFTWDTSIYEYSLADPSKISSAIDPSVWKLKNIPESWTEVADGVIMRQLRDGGGHLTSKFQVRVQKPASNVELPYKAKGQEVADKILFDTIIASISLVAGPNLSVVQVPTLDQCKVFQTLEFRETGMVFNVNGKDLLSGQTSPSTNIRLMLNTAGTYSEISSYPANFCVDNESNGTMYYNHNKMGSIEKTITLHGAPIYTADPTARPEDTYCTLKLIIN